MEGVMLLTFSVENFASIGKKQTISLISGKARGKKEHLIDYYNKHAVKFTSIYGANASGKTSIIKAMHFGKRAIQHGCIDKRFMSPNRSIGDWLDKTTEFTYTVFLNNKIYEYGFTILWQKELIVKEWLIEQNSREAKKTIFIRDFINEYFEFNLNTKNSELKSRLNMYFADSNKEENSLFLNNINFRKGNLFEDYPSLQFLQTIYLWFTTKLKFVYPNNNADLGEYSFLHNKNENEKLYDYLKLLDIPITEMNYIEIPIEQAFKNIGYELIQKLENDVKKMAQQENTHDGKPISIIARINDNYFIIDATPEGFHKIQTVQFTHGNFGKYDFKEESDGTKRMLELLEILISPEDDITYVVDEIDRSLHPLLTEEFILLYLKQENQKAKQLIITTHESRLLNLNNLRKDEIYFATNYKGESSFTRLDEYDNGNARTDVNIELAYLRGRYNAIPNVIKPESD